ncbi:cation transport regulator ChaB [Kocuria sp. JC486]|uniref:Cation transport regulator ChaB n=1 Tax=Kocuria soli TaxID=2485125 RepID=A0A3N4A439_9MICC|nr:ChaB family protein [Kocuria soli]NHU84962.1 cation transport regulator ChaB [Kocuria sp. JC486]ROZ63318.1 cation transport regulator ChaB [Kocuria soli]
MSPKNTSSGDANVPEVEDLPSTLQRSDDKAQRTYAEALGSAEEQYDDEARAHQTAWAALKRTHEKVGDHWEPKDEPGPSDERSEGPNTRKGETSGGVDANASKEHLYEVAQRLDIDGRSEMTKEELVAAIQKANDREDRQARDNG